MGNKNGKEGLYWRPVRLRGRTVTMIGARINNGLGCDNGNFGRNINVNVNVKDKENDNGTKEVSLG